MSEDEKMAQQVIEMVAHAARLRGMYDQLLVENNALRQVNKDLLAVIDEERKARKELIAAHIAELSRMKEAGEQLYETAKDLPTVLNDAITRSAPEFCDKKTLKDAYKRFQAGGGTLAYFVNAAAYLRKGLAHWRSLTEPGK